MNPQAQRIALAELAGWSFCNHPQCQRWHDPVLNEPRDLPDYLNDLNSAATLFEVNSEYIPVLDFCMADYVRELSKVVLNYPPNDLDMGELYLLCNATADQRCEALLRTLGKWTYDEKRDSHLEPAPTSP